MTTEGIQRRCWLGLGHRAGHRSTIPPTTWVIPAALAARDEPGITCLAVGNAQIAVVFRILKARRLGMILPLAHPSHAPPPAGYVFNYLLICLIVILSADTCKSDWFCTSSMPSHSSRSSITVWQSVFVCVHFNEPKAAPTYCIDRNVNTRSKYPPSFASLVSCGILVAFMCRLPMSSWTSGRTQATRNKLTRPQAAMTIFRF